MRFSTSIAALAAAFGAAGVLAAPVEQNPIKCNANNLLRALRRFSTDATSFCSTYTLSTATANQQYPTYLRSYTASTSAISSGCTCLNGPATTTPAPTTTTLGAYAAITPTETSTHSAYRPVNPTDIPKVDGAPLPLQTRPVIDAIPPTQEQEVFYGALGSDDKTVFLSHVVYTALDGAPVVNLDELIPGLTGSPTCGVGSIGITFNAQNLLDAAKTEWQNKQFTLVTSGGTFCGLTGESNFYKVSATSFSGLSVTLTTQKVDIKDAIAEFDAEFGTIDLTAPPPSKLRARFEKRGINFDGIWDAVSDFFGDLKNGWGFKIPVFRLSMISDQILETWIGDTSMVIHCSNCGFSAMVNFWGEVHFNIERMQTFGATIGFELADIEVNIDSYLSLRLAMSKTLEVILAEFSPYNINIRNVFAISPSIQLVANLEIDAQFAIQVDDIGFNSKWNSWRFGYNAITKKPTFEGSLVPASFEPLEPRFSQGVTVVGFQGGSVSMWVGPRIWAGLTIGSTDIASFDVTFQFPNIRTAVKGLERNQCADPPAVPDSRDRCTWVYSDAWTRLTASGSLAGVWEDSVTIWEQRLAVLGDGKYSWDWPL